MESTILEASHKFPNLRAMEFTVINTTPSTKSDEKVLEELKREIDGRPLHNGLICKVEEENPPRQGGFKVSFSKKG